MSRIVHEFFEGTGYEESWSETVPAGCTIDEDESSLNAANPVPLNWAEQCLKVEVDGGAEDCITQRAFGDTAITFTCFDVRISAHNFTADAQQASLFALTDSAGNALGLVQLVRVSGSVLIRYFVGHNGSLNVIFSQTLEINKQYRFELKWDTVADLWQLWAGGLSGSGSLTGAAATRLANTVILGDALNSVATFTARFDRVEVDDAERVGSSSHGWLQSLDSAIRIARSATATLGGAIQIGRSAGSSLDAAIQQARSAAAGLDSAIRYARSAAASMDAHINLPGQMTASASVDAAIREGRSVLAELGAAILIARSATSSLDAALSIGRSATAGADAVIQTGRSANASLEAALQRGESISATLGGFVSLGGTPMTLTASLSASIVVLDDREKVQFERDVPGDALDFALPGRIADPNLDF